MSNYTITHCHTHISNIIMNYDSTLRTEDLIKFCVENNMTSLSVTNHGVVFDWMKVKK